MASQQDTLNISEFESLPNPTCPFCGSNSTLPFTRSGESFCASCDREFTKNTKVDLTADTCLIPVKTRRLLKRSDMTESEWLEWAAEIESIGGGL